MNFIKRKKPKNPSEGVVYWDMSAQVVDVNKLGLFDYISENLSTNSRGTYMYRIEGYKLVSFGEIDSPK